MDLHVILSVSVPAPKSKPDFSTTPPYPSNACFSNLHISSSIRFLSFPDPKEVEDDFRIFSQA